MSKFVVKKVSEPKEFEGQYGKMSTYTLMGELDGELDSVQLNTKSSSPAPKIGDELEGTVETTQYGKKFKKSAPQGSGGGYSGGKSDPETQSAIIRQNALTNSVAFCVAKANLMTKEKGLELLTGKTIIEVATVFAEFSAGKISTTPKVISDSEVPAVKEVAEEVFNDPREEIDPSDIPF